MATATMVQGESVDAERAAILVAAKAELARRLEDMDVGEDVLLTRDEFMDLAFGSAWGGCECEQRYLERTEIEP